MFNTREMLEEDFKKHMLTAGKLKGTKKPAKKELKLLDGKKLMNWGKKK